MGLVGVPLLPTTGDQVANSDEVERAVTTTQSASRASQAPKLLVGQTWRYLTAENLLTTVSQHLGEQDLGDIMQ